MPHIAIVILSVHLGRGLRLTSSEGHGAAARHLLHKDAAEGDLIEAIQAVNQGKTFFSSEISKMLVEDYILKIRTSGLEDSLCRLLTSREREILQLLVERQFE